MNYFEIINPLEDINLSDFASSFGIKLNSTSPNKFDLDDLFNFGGNKERIRNSLTSLEQDVNSVNAIVKTGVKIRFPKENILTEDAAVSGNTVIPNKDFQAFFDEKIKEIIGDTDYKPVNRDELETKYGKVFRFKEEISVWAWSRALGRIINLTPFVESVTTNVTDQGGNFDIQIMPIIGYLNKSTGDWEIDQNSLELFAWNGVTNIVKRSSILKYNQKRSIYERNEYFFSQVLKSNDLVFIKFESLESEKDRRNRDKERFSVEELFVDKKDLADSDKPKKQLFDMIGLIDVVHENRNAQAINSISVQGRDMMKILLEDGVYFFPSDISGVNGPIQTTSNSKAFERLVTGELNFFNAYMSRSIDFSLRFIFNILANIRITEDNLFDYYGLERTTRYDLIKDNQDLMSSDQLRQELAPGIWQIIKIAIDESISERRIVDTSIVSDRGSLKSFIDGKVIQNPFVEFYGDTYGNQYYFIARKPPFNQESFISNARFAIDVESSQIINSNLQYSDEEIYSWYRIIPRGNFFGDDESLSLAEFPVVFLKEYAEIWGSRPLQVVSNYVYYSGKDGEKGNLSLDYMVKQTNEDLEYLIQCNAYLPFARKGTITIKGDRRIKRGMCIRLKGSEEIFHVDGVSQSMMTSNGSIDRNTTIQVSRGLKEFFLNKRDVQLGGKNYRGISYFNIVNTEDKSSSKNFRVNPEVFEFFIKQKQLAF